MILSCDVFLTNRQQEANNLYKSSPESRKCATKNYGDIIVLSNF